MQTVQTEWCHTFSIVARDPETGALGVAVQSKAFSVGSLVPWVRGGVGAIATQAYTDPQYGVDGLRGLAQGIDPASVLEDLLGCDADRDVRQVAMIDGRGRVGVHTGSGCPEHASSLVGDNFACQGNLLASQDVIEAMADGFRETKSSLERRLIASLHAGQRAGGDRRGQQSAALLVNRSNADSYMRRERIDLRVDDHLQPIAELERLLDLYDLYLPEPVRDSAQELKVDHALTVRLQQALARLGLYDGEIHGRIDPRTRDSFDAFLWHENLSAALSAGSTLDERIVRLLERLAVQNEVPRSGA